jgi:hypothetical protein
MATVGLERCSERDTEGAKARGIKASLFSWEILPRDGTKDAPHGGQLSLTGWWGLSSEKAGI